VEDLIVVGGGFAGLSAALTLGRTGRRVVVIDSGRPRNRFAAHSHGLFGWDGAAPGEMLAQARGQVLGYRSVRIETGTVSDAARDGAAFRVTLHDGSTLAARRLLIAAGVIDVLPPVDGLAARWGKTVLHCPYCHGYEVKDGRLGVLAQNGMAVHQAVMLAEWGAVTLLTTGWSDLVETQRVRLAARRVKIEPVPVRRIAGAGEALDGVDLADGRQVALDALFISTRVVLGDAWIQRLGCAVDEGPLGALIHVDERRATSVSGVYAAGDCARQPHNASFATADGVAAAMAIHMSLIEEDITAAV
jgi:thioredoxin reductase